MSQRSSNDKYEIFLKLSQMKSKNMSASRNQQITQNHPSILNGRRNLNSASYKKACQTSDIFKENVTPIKQRKYNEASSRKLLESFNSVRTLRPNEEVFNSPQKATSRSNVRYNVNSESIQKEPRRVLKSCKQKETDFNHRINLPISAMQVKDFQEDTQVSSKKQFDLSAKLKYLHDYHCQLSSMNIQQSQKMHKTERDQQKSQLLTSFQQNKSDSKTGKKVDPQSKKLYETSSPSLHFANKPQHFLYQRSSKEIYDTIRCKSKGKVQGSHTDIFKSQLDLL